MVHWWIELRKLHLGYAVQRVYIVGMQTIVRPQSASENRKLSPIQTVYV